MTTSTPVTDQEAQIAAEHATIVQGGFSTPEIERERIAKDRERGGATPEQIQQMAQEVEQAKVQQATDASTSPTGAEIDTLVSQAVDLVKGGTVKMSDLLKALSPKQESEPPPAVVPTAKPLTKKQQEALNRVPEVVGKVVPTERRALQPTEVSSLVEEKETLDVVKKTAEERLADITATVHNHLDVVLEEAGKTEGVLRDGKGHYVHADRAGAPDQEMEFSRETRTSSASLDEAVLKDLLDHEDYLASTTQVRVLDEAKVLLLIKKKPHLVHVLAKATRPGKTGTSMFLRKRK